MNAPAAVAAMAIAVTATCHRVRRVGAGVASSSVEPARPVISPN
jgi:hypothetical protein